MGYRRIVRRANIGTKQNAPRCRITETHEQIHILGIAGLLPKATNFFQQGFSGDGDIEVRIVGETEHLLTGYLIDGPVGQLLILPYAGLDTPEAGFCENGVTVQYFLVGKVQVGIGFPQGRRRDPRIGEDRQALIMSGAAILQALLRCWPTDRLSVADRGLREGLLYAQMSADGVLEDGPF